MTFFILAGGFGTRLRSVVSDLPKPMAPVCGKPFLYYQIDAIRSAYPDAPIYLLTHYMHEVIDTYFSPMKNIGTICEETPLGTGGAVMHALEQTKTDGAFMVINGDTYIEADMKEFSKNAMDAVTILGCKMKQCDRYGTLRIEGEKVVGFDEKKEGVRDSYINAGCYLFQNAGFFEEVTERAFALETYFAKRLKEGEKFGLYCYEGVFIDIGIPEDYAKMNEYIRYEYGT